jgi:hypothetical protein
MFEALPEDGRGLAEEGRKSINSTHADSSKDLK